MLRIGVLVYVCIYFRIIIGKPSNLSEHYIYQTTSFTLSASTQTTYQETIAMTVWGINIS